MTVTKIVSFSALAALLGANVASAQQIAVFCPTSAPYYENGLCTPYYPYPGHGQVINGVPVVPAPIPGTNTAQTGGSVLGASTNVANLPSGAVNMTGQGTVQIVSTGTSFAPSVIAVTEGSTVTFANNGTGDFTFQAPGIYGFTSGLVPVGGTFTRVFEIPGTYTFQGMHNGQVASSGTIVVLPKNMATTVNTGGSVLGATTNQSNLPATDASAATTVNGAATGQTVVQVGIFDNFFNPHNVIITQGSTVTWTNRGAGTHSLVADNGSFASGALGPGATYSRIFNTPGTYVYYDTVNGSTGGQGMFGIIVVLPPGQTTTGGGSVLGAATSFPNVPNTGAGGASAAVFAVLALAGGATLLGSYLFLRRRSA